MHDAFAEVPVLMSALVEYLICQLLNKKMKIDHLLQYLRWLLVCNESVSTIRQTRQFHHFQLRGNQAYESNFEELSHPVSSAQLQKNTN